MIPWQYVVIGLLVAVGALVSALWWREERHWRELKLLWDERHELLEVLAKGKCRACDGSLSRLPSLPKQ